MDFPEDLRYTKEHEWARLKGDVVTIGITEYAQDSLGEIVFVELPEEGAEVNQGESIGSLESVKAVSDLFSPISGTVSEINDSLSDSPEMINEDPYGDAWMVRIKISNKSELDGLMDAASYKKFVETLAES